MSSSRWKTRLAHVATTVVALLVTCAAITVVLGSFGGHSTHPASTDHDPESLTFAETPLVNRVLADLGSGRQPESQDQPLTGAPVRLVKASPQRPAPIGELSIPVIGLHTKVFEGVNEDALRNGPGHWPGTPAFGQPGNTVLSGHRSTETRPFLYLDQLSAGDRITITEGTERFSYAVDNVTIVPQAGYVRYVLEQPANPRTRMLTLFACNPLTAHYERIVVQARAVDGRRP